MQQKVFLFFFCIFALTHASWVPTVEVLQGPSSKTTLVGPDGSILNAAAPGGSVVTRGAAGLVPAGPALLGVGAPIAVKGPAGAVITSYSGAGSAVVPAVVAGGGIVAGPAAHGGVAVGGIVSGDPDDNGYQGAYLGDHSGAWNGDGSHWE